MIVEIATNEVVIMFNGGYKKKYIVIRLDTSWT